MCGLAGGIADDIALFLKHALARLEYRGYDSWGYCVVYGPEGRHHVHRELGAPSAYDHNFQNGRLGIGHTRWATHGEVSTRNTHPVQSGGWFVVHNGVVENHELFRTPLFSRRTETDTEAIGLAISLEFGCDDAASWGVPLDPLPALYAAVQKLRGRFAFAAVAAYGPVNEILLATTGSPLVVAPEEKLFASDVQALAGFAKRAYSVKPGYCLVLSEEGIQSLPDDDWRGPEIAVPEADWSCPTKTRGQWMLREMLEQPGLIREFVSADCEHLLDADQLCLYGVGSSLHAAMLGEWFLRECDIECVAWHALDGVRVISDVTQSYLAITQSGESKVVLDEAELNISHDPDAYHAVLTNRPESSATRLEGLREVRLMGCGPERAVAATKSFTMTALHLWGLSGDDDLTQDTLSALADTAEAVLRREEVIRPTFIAGDGPGYALTLEGALKFKEVAYLHTEGVRLSDIQHGPLAMLRPEDTVLVLAADKPDMTRIEELRSRGIGLAVVCAESEKEKFEFAKSIYPIPDLPWQARAILTGILLQKLAYNAAMQLHTDDPDMPRHLAKSVTV